MGTAGRPGDLRQPFLWAGVPLFGDATSETVPDTAPAASGAPPAGPGGLIAGQLALRPLYRYEGDRVGMADILDALAQSLNPRHTKKGRSVPGELSVRIAPVGATDALPNVLSATLLPVQARGDRIIL
jgi:hypothetical protein